jgi:hypothetical protein
MKKPVANQSRQPAENKAAPGPAPEGKVFVELLPGRGIGGVGGPGTQAWMDQAEAEQYAADGYVRILPAQPVTVVPSDAAGEKGK